jgi:hypothetical protein
MMSTINDLPNELLLETLSYLDYSDLQNCLQATKTLRAIAFHPALDHKLFRSKAIKHKHDTIDMDTFTIHPIFDRIFFTNKMLLPEGPDGHVSRCTNEFFHTGVPVVQSRVHDDNVTSPPVSYISFGVDFLENKDKSAITIGQIFNKFIRQYVEIHEECAESEFEFEEEFAESEFESHVFGFQIHYAKPRSTQRGGTKKHVRLECKDTVIKLHHTEAMREHFIYTRSKGAAFLGPGCGD